MGVRSAFLLLPMLGTGWILGLATNWSEIMAYIFDIIMSVQVGQFIRDIFEKKRENLNWGTNSLETQATTTAHGPGT